MSDSKASATVEDYLKKICLEAIHRPDGLVPLNVVARSMGVTPGTTTSMMKSLHSSGYATYISRVGVKLTREGTTLALKTLRRHRLIEAFLTEMLDLDWAEVHTEAEALEHVVSDRVLDRIDAILGKPKWDPHGKPIPTTLGEMPERELTKLSNLHEGSIGTIAEVDEESSDFLRYAGQNGLNVGAQLTVVRKDEAGQILEIGLQAGTTAAISFAAAALVHVEEARK